MRNRKQILADFYLDMLKQDVKFKCKHIQLYDVIVEVLASELESDVDTVGEIFRKMAREDEKH